MNFNFYILGTPSGTYSQYPDDYSSTMFSNFTENIVGARLVIHRDHDLMHYFFAEKIDSSNYLGFCIIFNKARICNPKQLVEFFKTIINDYATNGELIEFQNDGKLAFSISSFAKSSKVHSAIKKHLDQQFNSPTNDFGIENLNTTYNGVNTSDEINFDASNNDIIKLTEKFNTVYVSDNIGIKSNQIYATIDGLRKSNYEAQKEITSLKEEIIALERQKKQYGFVILLILCILLCGLGLFSLRDNLISTENNLKIARNEIDSCNNIIFQKISTIDSLFTVNNDLNNLRITAENDLTAFKTLVSEKTPLIITDANINWSNGMYKFNYYGFANRIVKITIRTYNNSGYYRENTIDFNVHSGENVGEIYIGGSNLDSGKWHSFIIFDGYRILGGTRH